ncbi:unnamed protein product [Bathycoccus prasinos]
MCRGAVRRCPIGEDRLVGDSELADRLAKCLSIGACVHHRVTASDETAQVGAAEGAGIKEEEVSTRV